MVVRWPESMANKNGNCLISDQANAEHAAIAIARAQSRTSINDPQHVLSMAPCYFGKELPITMRDTQRYLVPLCRERSQHSWRRRIFPTWQQGISNLHHRIMDTAAHALYNVNQ
jgi:hypothetical protein